MNLAVDLSQFKLKCYIYTNGLSSVYIVSLIKTISFNTFVHLATN